MSIKFGPHVVLSGVTPELACAFPVISGVFEDFGLTAEVTSVKDRSHSRNSLHYAGAAADVIWYDTYPADPQQVRRALYISLNGFPPEADIPPEFDVVFEGDHFHVEFQPKIPPREYTRLVWNWMSNNPSPVADR